MRSLTSTSLLLSLAMLSGCEASRLDQQMEELCKKDGGVTVHQTVTLPPTRFDTTGRLVTGAPQKHGRAMLTQTIGSDYLIEHKEDVIKAGNPFSGVISEGRLLRHITTVRRIADDKEMGVEITYGRTGGDITLGHPSQHFCPRPKPNPGVVHAVFIKGE